MDWAAQAEKYSWQDKSREKSEKAAARTCCPFRKEDSETLHDGLPGHNEGARGRRVSFRDIPPGLHGVRTSVIPPNQDLNAEWKIGLDGISRNDLVQSSFYRRVCRVVRSFPRGK